MWAVCGRFWLFFGDRRGLGAGPSGSQSRARRSQGRGPSVRQGSLTSLETAPLPIGCPRVSLAPPSTGRGPRSKTQLSTAPQLLVTGHLTSVAAHETGTAVGHFFFLDDDHDDDDDSEVDDDHSGLGRPGSASEPFKQLNRERTTRSAAAHKRGTTADVQSRSSSVLFRRSGAREQTNGKRQNQNGPDRTTPPSAPSPPRPR